MKLMWNIGKRMKGDSRYTLLRLESNRFIYGKGYSLSLSLHPFIWKFFKGWREFRLTFCGINVHYRGA